MNNLSGGETSLHDLKFATCAVPQSLLLRVGDILFNRTNSKELVGKCAVFHAGGVYVFASYLIRVRIDATQANPDFVAFALNSPIGRQQIDALSRQITGQANVNSEELRSLQIPLPLLPAQAAVMKRVESARTEIVRLKTEEEARIDAARADVEAMILGTKPVS